MTLDGYAIFCILWTITAGLVQTLHPAYAKYNTWKTIIITFTMNYIGAPIFFVWAMLKWNTDILILIVKEKMKRDKEYERQFKEKIKNVS